MPLVLIRAVADFAKPVKEYGAAEGITLLTVVETYRATAAQLGGLATLKD